MVAVGEAATDFPGKLLFLCGDLGKDLGGVVGSYQILLLVPQCSRWCSSSRVVFILADGGHGELGAKRERL
jgi:hypothetical protein